MLFFYNSAIVTTSFFYRRLLYLRRCLLLLLLSACCVGVKSQPAFFIDGYHGGYWGHYPENFTSFITQQLTGHPAWKINLEIEPVTWDWVQQKDTAGYRVITAMYAAQDSLHRRIEFVNPAYGQSYLYTISGESIIRQLYYGIRKIRTHFPDATFTTYSSEEPCFTSALPQLLSSFGFRYASLKNPNTCWGGYTRAYGGQFVNWTGPDGTTLLTVPRYAVEALKSNSTWETLASTNAPAFIQAAQHAGIAAPAGMCLQDAGWRNGPWLGKGSNGYQPVQYALWTDYIQQHPAKALDWKLSQEDIQVSLVWGGQIVQRVAQAVRAAENKLITAEKTAALSAVFHQTPWPQPALDTAWQNLLLAQHHDCWIVPYNRRNGKTWEQYVQQWTGITRYLADSILQQATALPGTTTAGRKIQVTIWNTHAAARKELVRVPLPDSLANTTLSLVDATNHPVPVQRENGYLLFTAAAPPTGFTSYTLTRQPPPVAKGAAITVDRDGKYILHTDLYTLVLDPAHGGVVQSCVAKQLGNKEFAATSGGRYLNELRGFFYEQGKYYSTADEPATIRIIENGPLRITVAINSQLAGNPCVQTISLTQNQPRIDLSLHIRWLHPAGIGAYDEKGSYDNRRYKKAFYDDRYKLLSLCPLALGKHQVVYKDAPFDVTRSRLSNTFFTSWDSIKNNIMLSWTDVTDAQGKYGFTLLTDHTTSYTHGEDFPLGFTVQYAGMGLFGMNYTVNDSTAIHYAWLPHAGDYTKAQTWDAATCWKEPLVVTPCSDGNEKPPGDSLLQVQGKGWELTALTVSGKHLLARFFNAAGDAAPHTIVINRKLTHASIESLNGKTISAIPVVYKAGKSSLSFGMPRGGIRTVKLDNVLP